MFDCSFSVFIELFHLINSLMYVVFPEHESCANNISELKWFIKYRSRTETRTREKVNTAQLLNSRLKEEIEHVKLHMFVRFIRHFAEI